MANHLLVTVGGYRREKNKYCEYTAVMNQKSAMNRMNQLLTAMIGFIPQIEDRDHPLAGLHVVGLTFEAAQKEFLDTWPSIDPDYWELTEESDLNDDDDDDDDESDF